MEKHSYDAYDAYVMFLALRSHFANRGYDYFKYNGKMNTKFDKFMERKDRYFFHKLSKKKDPEGYIIASLIENPNFWITDIINQEGEERYALWVKRRDSLTYMFKQDIGKIDISFNDALNVVDGQHPRLLEMLLEKDVSLETVIIINKLTEVLSRWNKKINDPVIWPEKYNILKTYSKFLNIDDEKLKSFRKIVVDKFTKTV